MNVAFLKSFETLRQVFQQRAFSTLALNKTLQSCTSQNRALITKIVYGVLDEDIKLKYILSKYVRKMPKGDVLIVFEIGLYCLLNLSLPVYTVVNDCAELAKITEDRRQVGFVNATLKKMCLSVKQFDDYPEDAVTRLSVKYSYPEWALRKLIKDYGTDVAEKIVSFVPDGKTSVRIADDKAKENFSVLIPTVFPDAFLTDGKLPVSDGTFTPQSLSSMAVARAVSSASPAEVLDCCSAPGGKAVYVKQLCPNAHVVACDVHAHRVDLIRQYASRMGVQLDTFCADMTQYNAKWEKGFDAVLCDVPCSGFGVLDSRPDIKLFRENIDISNLMKLQYAILENCCNYVKVGGRLIYSTCTVFDNENGQNIRKFLKQHCEFSLGTIDIPQLPQTQGKSTYQFLPYKDGMQGFFLAVLVRNN